MSTTRLQLWQEQQYTRPDEESHFLGSVDWHPTSPRSLVWVCVTTSPAVAACLQTIPCGTPCHAPPHPIVRILRRCSSYVNIIMKRPRRSPSSNLGSPPDTSPSTPPHYATSDDVPELLERLTLHLADVERFADCSKGESILVKLFPAEQKSMRSGGDSTRTL